MLRFARENWPLAVLLMALAVGAGVLGFRPSVSGDDVLVWLTASLALFTALLWWETNRSLAKARHDSERQAEEFKHQLEVSKRSAEALMLAQRPWIAVDLKLLKVAREQGLMKWLFSPVCTNIGNTPATNIRVSVAIAPHPISPYDFTPVIAKANKRLADPPHRGFALFPSETDARDGANHNECFSQADLEAALAGGASYVVTACVLVHYAFPGGRGVTRRIYIIAADDDDEEKYFNVGSVSIDAERTKITRVPLSELAS